MWKSFKSYVSDLGYWGFIVIAPILLDAIAIYQLASGNTFTGIHSWVWFQVAFVCLLFIPFIAYHRIRVKLQTITDTRVQELARLILEVRDKAATAVMHAKIQGLTEAEKMNDHKLYTDAIEKLHREAEIEGVKIRDAISAGFTAFVGFHVVRFLAWDGKIVSDADTKRKLEIDEYQFIGAMAGRADKTIESIRGIRR